MEASTYKHVDSPLLINYTSNKMTVKILMFFGLIFSSLSSHISEEDNSVHRHIENLSPTGSYVLEWIVDWERSRVIFNATVRTRGYVGFGLSAKGLMAGADIVIGGVLSDGTPYFSDRHGVTGNEPPIMDTSQDWKLHSAWENETHTSLNFSRPFDTCDEDDYKIKDNLIALMWAFGENDNEDLYHYRNRGHFSTYLLDPDFTPRVIQEALRNKQELSSGQLGDLKVWTLTRRQRVPQKDTTYWCSFNKGPRLQRKHHLVGFNLRRDTEEVSRHTHHLLLLRCKAPANSNPVTFFNPFVQNSTGEECYFLQQHSGQLPTRYCTDIQFAYAIGERMFFLPEHAGIAFGENPDEYYLLQVHYDNPNVLQTLEYDINIDLYYTSELRENEAGIITVGHQIPGLSASILVPPHSLEHHIYGHCGRECTSKMIPKSGINIVGIQLHTHNAGTRLKFSHIRGNKELPWISNDDNYNNNLQLVRMLRNEVKILPGDHMMARCVYDTTRGNGTVVGGFSTKQEMCLVYIWYYNKMPGYWLCRSEIASPFHLEYYLGVTNTTWSNPKLEYEATAPESLAGLAISQVSNEHVNWTTGLREELQQDHRNYPQVNVCPLSPSFFNGESSAASMLPPLASVPVNLQEYVPPGSECARSQIPSYELGWGRQTHE